MVLTSTDVTLNLCNFRHVKMERNMDLKPQPTHTGVTEATGEVRLHRKYSI